MLDDHQFCDHCPGCRPTLLDIETRKPLEGDSPVMIKINQLWDHGTTYEQRKAFIKVTLHNSRSTEDMRLATEVIKRMQEAT